MSIWTVEYAAQIKHLEAENARLTAEVERLKLELNDTITELEWQKWLADSLGEGCQQFKTENERLRAALDGLVKHESSIKIDVLSAHRNRGNGASQWMSEDDADFRRNLRQAFETACAALNKEPRT